MYRTTMRFFTNSDEAIEVRWYPAPEGAQAMPYTRFASGDWAYERVDWKGPGEVLGAPRTWINWDTPASARGDHYCGTPDEWRNGIPAPAAGVNVMYDRWGLPACCNPGMPGGTADGGGAFFGNPPGGTIDGGTGFPSTSHLLIAEGGDLVSGEANYLAGFFVGDGGDMSDGDAGNLDGFFVGDGGDMSDGDAGNLDGFFVGDGGDMSDGSGF